ncbi:Bug family tripartite tricarboxylate transporter substrate binding protein [Blastococcus saxobsidens]|uniref:Tripartite-type tricarboxylate transporter receptor subunit TctC n=1 Tax=Blastococcus saxobsidens TaxID=138336 RepID=A0A4Q7YBF5_9ACTN|nr:tripartite tricarboxylate transporter substrate binding protein [Blastococcus saxobsidens]RZU33465.1 tripartite-type tricarboxylate transporter receptor subunit TctC [Blastococcus saxobsidens]
MSSTKARHLRPGRLAALAAAALLPVSLAACGDDSGAGGAQAEGDPAACENYPSEDVTLLVPYSAGGGFDAWARLLAPFLEEELGGEAAVRVENQPGGGGMRAINTVYSAEPDGTTLVFTEPGYVAVNQILGNVEEGFDVTNLAYLGQTTADPQVFVVAADSDIETIEDLVAAGPVKHAGQDISPIETITYDAYGVEAEYILHEGTSDVVLAVRRGDSDVAVASLSSILPFMEAGEVKPILYLGTEEITPELVGYEQLQGVQTAAETGHPELADVLEQHRVLVTAPGTPDCIAEPLEEALMNTLENEEFLQLAEESDLRVVPASGEEAAEFVSNTVETFAEYEDVLEEAAG